MKNLSVNHRSIAAICNSRKCYLFVLFATCLLCFVQCEKDPTDIPEEINIDWEGDLNVYLMGLPEIDQEMPVEQEETLIDEEESDDDNYYYTSKTYYAAAGFNEQIVLNPATDVIYPGALVKGESILDGTYTLIPAQRKPITISTSLTGAESVYVVVDDPKLSTIRQAVSELMTQEYSVPPANIGFEIFQAYSEEQLALSLHASYKGKSLKISGGFDYTKNVEKTRLVVKFIQSYYTLDMDMPQNPSDLFEADIDSSFFGTYAPMYLATVTYGRLALFTIESSLSEDSVKVYLNGSYKKISADASAEFDRLVATSEMKAYILGGSGEDASGTIDGFDSFKNYIKNGGNYSKDSPGAVISYKLRNIKDNSIAKIVYAANYSIVEKIPKQYNISTIKAFKIISTGNKDELGQGPDTHELVGTIKCWPTGNREKEVTLWSNPFTNGSFIVSRNVWTNLELDKGETYSIVEDNIDFNDVSEITLSFDIYDWDYRNDRDYLGKTEVNIPMSEITAGKNGHYEKIVVGDNIQVVFIITYLKN